VLTALVTAAFSSVISALLGIDDDDESTFRVLRRIARRRRGEICSDRAGLIFLEIDGLALPVLRHALQNGSAPTLSRWLRDGSHSLFEWETDLSLQTGASRSSAPNGSTTTSWAGASRSRNPPPRRRRSATRPDLRAAAYARQPRSRSAFERVCRRIARHSRTASDTRSMPTGSIERGQRAAGRVGGCRS